MEEASAVSVTVCAVDQLLGVKVSVPPEVTDSPVLPEVRVVVTVTFALGWLDSFTVKLPVLPWFTESVTGVAVTAGPDATVMPAGVDSLLAPRLSYALA